jgi:hypothetical protein
MRVNSPKQAKASRENGAKSRDPKSQAATSKSAQNAIHGGIFSRQVVVEQLGEKQADFDETCSVLKRGTYLCAQKGIRAEHVLSHLLGIRPRRRSSGSPANSVLKQTNRA